MKINRQKMKRFAENHPRLNSLILWWGSGAIATLLIGSLISIATHNFLKTVVLVFFLFNAPLIIVPLFDFIFGTKENNIWYSCGFYYGAIFIKAVLEDISSSSTLTIFAISAAISLTVCITVHKFKLKQARIEELESYERLYKELEQWKDAARNQGRGKGFYDYIIDAVREKAERE